MTHQFLTYVAMKCHRCKHWTDGIHVLSETTGSALDIEYVGACCCPVCVQKPPLEENEIKPVEGAVQGGLFE